ncbi:MAG: flagellar export protein FliJ [Nitrospina sp.]|nr:flagellar export protein FliJ [Nitrospina sp.]MBT3856714.1 flagellar export protein FliJ [Nitrospina sp.]MBT4105359.1 flagellar export protein FliJ [Nitrospina sp.]MBT4390649.1 flagellar export protein FliJ [Nitrospina sp.]MBT4620671.1 flagellar export protein FliJ [Nitrospina sp.]
MSFRFDIILRLRKNKEDLLKKDMGLINTLYQQQQDQRQFVQDATEKSRNELNQKKRLNVGLGTMILYDNFFQGTQAQEERQGKIISEITTRLEAKREEVVEAMRKRRTLEILKDRDALKERKIREKKETAILDEVASNLWGRNL